MGGRVLAAGRLLRDIVGLSVRGTEQVDNRVTLRLASSGGIVRASAQHDRQVRGQRPTRQAGKQVSSQLVGQLAGHSATTSSAPASPAGSSPAAGSSAGSPPTAAPSPGPTAHGAAPPTQQDSPSCRTSHPTTRNASSQATRLRRAHPPPRLRPPPPPPPRLRPRPPPPPQVPRHPPQRLPPLGGRSV